VTVRVTDVSDLHALPKAGKLNGFDVVAVKPESDDLFARCCESANVDIVTLDFSLRGNWNAIIIKNVEKVKVRGAFFEVGCAPAFRSKDSDRVS
jgi:RNase P/RNase MRP subunit p30